MRDNVECRPIAHDRILDRDVRAQIVDALHRSGWAVIEQPTGLHLIHAISGVILGDEPWLRPGLIVADRIGRGCTGESIKLGLRDLGVEIPVVLIDAPGSTALREVARIARLPGSMFETSAGFATATA